MKHAIGLVGCVVLVCISVLIGSAQAPFVFVVGDWSAIDDGGPAWRIDGATWAGRTEVSSAQESGRILFGNASSEFVANVIAPGAFPLAVWRNVPVVRNGTLRVNFKLIAGETDQTAGIVFGLQPTGEYHYLRFNTRDNNLAVWRYAKGERQVITHGTSHSKLALNAWHQLTVTIAGTRVTGSIKHSEPLSVEHTFTAPLSGRVGLWTKRDSVTAFKDFTVTASR